MNLRNAPLPLCATRDKGWQHWHF